MAQFYGTIEGQARTKATRRGSKKSGLRTVTASWNGAIEVYFYHENGKDYFEINHIPWKGQGENKTIQRGYYTEDGKLRIYNCGEC